MKHYLFAIITILVILNIRLLYLEMDYKKQIKNLEVKTLERDLTFNDSFSSNYLVENSPNQNYYISHPEVEFSSEKINLGIFFKDNGCIDCIEYEVRKINELYDSKDIAFKVFLLSTNESLLKRLYDAKFPYKTLSTAYQVTNPSINFSNPIAFIYNEKGVIAQYHIAEKGKKEKSDTFYKQIESIFIK